MAWGTIRKATAEDEAKLQAVYDRFTKTHNVIAENVLFVEDDGSVGHGSCLRDEDGCEIGPCWALTLRRYLRRNIKRAIGGEGIAYGYVGYNAD